MKKLLLILIILLSFSCSEYQYEEQIDELIERKLKSINAPFSARIVGRNAIITWNFKDDSSFCTLGYRVTLYRGSIAIHSFSTGMYSWSGENHFMIEETYMNISGDFSLSIVSDGCYPSPTWNIPLSYNSQDSSYGYGTVNITKCNHEKEFGLYSSFLPYLWVTSIYSNSPTIKGQYYNLTDEYILIIDTELASRDWDQYSHEFQVNKTTDRRAFTLKKEYYDNTSISYSLYNSKILSNTAFLSGKIRVYPRNCQHVMDASYYSVNTSYPSCTNYYEGSFSSLFLDSGVEKIIIPLTGKVIKK